MLGTSTRTSDVLINLGLNPLRRLREVGSPQFGVLSARAPPSPRCTAYLQPRVESCSPELLVREYPETRRSQFGPDSDDQQHAFEHTA